MRKLAVVVTAAFVAFMLLLVIGPVAVVGTATSCVENAVVSGATKVLKSLSPVSAGYWSLANKIGLELGLNEKERQAAIATMQQESGSKNVRFGDRDSLGLFQQRPSQGWGTPDEILDPDHAIRSFYDRLMQIKNRDSKTAQQLAEAVQRPEDWGTADSVYNSPSNKFSNWLGDALSFIRKASGNQPEAPSGPTSNVASKSQIDNAELCSLGSSLGLIGKVIDKVADLGGVAGSGQLRYPTKDTTIDSKYGMRFHPIYRYWKLHNGVDFSEVSSGTPIYAAASGVVKKAGWGGGWGNFIQIDHGGGIQTGYAHQSRFAPGIAAGVEVDAGELIGYVGTTGTSTGNHLHFIVWKSGKYDDPAHYLKG